MPDFLLQPVELLYVVEDGGAASTITAAGAEYGGEFLPTLE